MGAGEECATRLSRAIAAAARGGWAAAREQCALLLAADPAHAEALHVLACVSSCEGELEIAASLLDRALAAQPCRWEWRRDLGVVFAASRKWPDAVHALAESLALKPDNPCTLLFYARALIECGEFQRALDVYQNSRRCLPFSAELYLGRGRALTGLQRFDEAARAIRRGMALDRDSPKGDELLADLYLRSGRVELEVVHRERAAALRPQDPTTIALAAAAYSHIGDIEKSVARFREALALGGTSPQTHSVFLKALLHHPDSTAATLLEAHRGWVAAHCDPVPDAREFPNTRACDRKIRVGYVSGEETSAPSFHFLIPILRNHDRARFETFFYHTKPSDNACTEAYRTAVDHWRALEGRTDGEIAKAIGCDGIDILVDVSGHYGRSALAVFAMRVAPVQVAYPNYPATTGLSQMDYILTDEWTCPDGFERQYAEEAYRLPSGYLAYQPPECAPPMTALPASALGEVTFGMFQRPSKFNAGVWDAIAQVLGRVPESKLQIHYSSIYLDRKGTAARARVAAALGARGVSRRRIRFRGALNAAEHMKLLAEVDIALDTFPYNGQTTTCECLWMGVPVVTLAGEAHVSQVCAGILKRVGLREWVAGSVEDYVEIAVRGARDLDGLAVLRAGMRARLATSSLMDPRRITAEIEDAYRCMLYYDY